MYASLRFPVAVVAAALAAGILAAAVPVSSWLVLAAGVGLVAGLLVADVRLAPRPDSLRLRREAPEVLRAGADAEVALVLHNPTSRPLRVSLRDASPPSLRRDPPRHELTARPGAWARLVSRVRPSRRGYATVGPVTVRTAGPLGLGGKQRTVRLDARVKVYPSLPARAEVRSRLERARALQAGERSANVRGGGTEFDSLREYHPDDEFRRINWRATARRTKPITNLYREERNQQVLVLLDAGRTMAGNVAGAPRFEHGIDAAFAVAELATRAGDQVGLEVFAGNVLAMVGPRGGPDQPRRILDALFDLRPQLGAADYVGAFSALLARYRRRSLLLLVTELTAEAVLEPLYAALPALLGRHLLVVGSVRDPEAEALAAAVPRSSEAAYLKAAATGALLDRDRAAARLLRMGVTVEDRPPGRLAGALADRYLRIKALGRL